MSRRRLAALAALATSLGACSFDASGVGGGASDDEPGAPDAASGADAPVQPVIDAPPPPPIDAAPPPPPIDAASDGSCSTQAECPGQQLCCQYGSIITACSDSCIGGARVCEDSFDCDGNDDCCDTLFGERECRAACF